jgi:hypothetical protein
MEASIIDLYIYFLWIYVNVTFYFCKKLCSDIPLLFCLVEDFLSRYLTRPVDLGSLIPISFPMGMHVPTHFIYADDVVLFCRAFTQNLHVILDAFELYGPLSGQRVNCEKSSIYFGKGISRTRITDFLSMYRTRKDGDSLTYVGIPLFINAPKCHWLMP